MKTTGCHHLWLRISQIATIFYDKLIACLPFPRRKKKKSAKKGSSISSNFAKGTRVRFVDSKEFYHGGSVAWTRYSFRKESVNKRVIVKLDDPEVAKKMNTQFDGCLWSDEEGVLLLKLLPSHVEALEKLRLGDFCVAKAGPTLLPFSAGFITCRNGNKVQFHVANEALGEVSEEQQQQIMEYPDYVFHKMPPYESSKRYERTPPIDKARLKLFLGRNKGIQGINNSSMLDSLLFSLFAFSDKVLTELEERAKLSSPSTVFHTAFGILRFQIVYPLRACGFVSDSHVESLLNQLSRENDDNFKENIGSTQTCFEVFDKIFGWTPDLEIGIIQNGAIQYYDSYVYKIPENSIASIPTTQNILEGYSLKHNVFLRKTPNFLFVQLPELNHQSLVVPSLELELKDIVLENFKVCCVCHEAAELQFPQRFNTCGLAGTFLCRACAEQRELQIETGQPLPEARVLETEPQTRLFLSTVICFIDSHYNCFVRCGSGNLTNGWVFFNSMSSEEELIDSDTGTTKNFCIPYIDRVPEFQRWIQHVEAELNGDIPLTFFDALTEEDKVLSSLLFKFPYMCLYTSV